MVGILLAGGLTACGSPTRAPSRPTHVIADAWNTFVFVQWTAPKHSGGGPITQFRIVSRPGTAVATVPGSQTWAVISPVVRGANYSFAVTAVNALQLRSAAAPSNVVTPLPPEIHVSGNHFVDGNGKPTRLVGVDRSGAEYTCVIGGTVGGGLISGPTDDAAIANMVAWRINAVRIPLNEDCWLGINGVNPADSGAQYRSFVTGFVQRLNNAGMVAILDLHWNAPGTQLSDRQQVMADADHAPAFWTSVATTLLQAPGVVFDLYNEPEDISWVCWLSGCTTSAGWRTAGMQSLVNAIRATGAAQPIVVAGLNYANDVSGWLAHMPQDPLHQLAVGLHMYQTGSPGYCDTVACWNASIAPVAARVPVMTTEMAEFDRRSDFVTTYIAWTEAQARLGHPISFAAWSWDAVLGEGGPSLIASYDGTPTRFGSGVRKDYAALWAQGEITQA